MKHEYMVVTIYKGNPHADFFTDYVVAILYKQKCENELGAYAQMYKLNKRGEYDFLYA